MPVMRSLQFAVYPESLFPGRLSMSCILASLERLCARSTVPFEAARSRSFSLSRLLQSRNAVMNYFNRDSIESVVEYRICTIRKIGPPEQSFSEKKPSTSTTILLTNTSNTPLVTSCLSSEDQAIRANNDTMAAMNVGGIYTDPYHSPITASANIYGLSDPWMGGLRLCGRDLQRSENEFVCLGSDDGVHFWTLLGNFPNPEMGKLTMDFTPKAPGVGKLNCQFVPEGAIHFLEDDGSIGNTWSRLQATSDMKLATLTKHDAFNNINGLYVDPSIYKEGSFAGIRVVSDRLGKSLRDEICVVGTDDGLEWWSCQGGKFTSKQKGAFQVGSFSGTLHDGTIQFDGDDKACWVKMTPTMNLHNLPKPKL